jgi:ParB-like chromosome segregation protein Spo0J
MEAHKYAKYFPVLENEEFKLLVDDIKKNGQLEPIILFEGKILDGVNRFNACKKLGIEPIIEEYDGDNPLSYVISVNIRRRHLNESQRAMLATEILPELEKQAKERKKQNAKEQRPEGSKKFMSSCDKNQELDKNKKDHLARDEAGKMFNVSGSMVQKAKRIKEEAKKEKDLKEEVNEIIQGKKTVTEVDREISEKKAEKREKEKQEKKDKKIPKEHPKAVKDFFDSIKSFKESINFAIKAANQGMFSPESKQFLENQKNKIIESMNSLIETIK